MIVKCRCGERIIILNTYETIEETRRPKKLGGEICAKCKRYIEVFALLAFDESRVIK